MITLLASLLLSISTSYTNRFIETPPKINKEWEQKYLGVSQDAVTVEEAIIEIQSRLVDDTFDHAFLERVKAFVQKNPTGEYVEYWSNGKIKAKVPYKDGKPHGHLHGWYEQGGDAFKGYFDKGLKQGIHMTFFPSNSTHRCRYICSLTFKHNGQLHGDQYRNYPNDELWFIATYKNGKPHGSLHTFKNQGSYVSSNKIGYRNGFLQTYSYPWNPRKSIEYRPDLKYVQEVKEKFCKAVMEKYGFVPRGGGGGMPFDVESISVDFAVKKKASKEDARTILVELKEMLASYVNAHEKLRPFLREYPFPPCRTEIWVYFYDENLEHYTDGSIAKIAACCDNLTTFYSYDPNKIGTKIEEEEPYAQSERIVHAQKIKERDSNDHTTH